MIQYDGTSHAVLFMNADDFQAYVNSNRATASKHSWNDWHLVPSEKPIIKMPEIKTKTVEIPGAHGIIDLSEVLTGYPVYGMRSGSLNFLNSNGYESWQYVHMDMAEYMHGKLLKMVLLDDPDFYYEGRFSLVDRVSQADRDKITINYVLNPFKRLVFSSNNWLWDPFNFKSGIITSRQNVKVQGTRKIRLPGSSLNTVPTITCSTAMTAVYKGVTYNLSSGRNVIQAIKLSSGTHELTVTGNGTISIVYEGGWL